MYYTYFGSPVGELLLAGEGGALKEIRFPRAGNRALPGPGWVESATELSAALRQLGEYFAGTRREFDLRLEPLGTTFQKMVWDALLAIPFGQTRSYAAIAASIGRPSATRAVGAANGANPIPIVIPCHRVIGANGCLTGYGGGLPIKETLLRLERGAWLEA